MARKKQLWMARINLTGLYSTQPIRGTWAPTLGEYYDGEGEISVEGAGLYEGAGCVTFASSSAKEVALWISGVLATTKMMKAWCS